jgi:hypothetical protein
LPLNSIRWLFSGSLVITYLNRYVGSDKASESFTLLQLQATGDTCSL